MGASFATYDPFDDYMDMSMQMGYVLLFSICWPLVAACASINNALEQRSDLYKDPPDLSQLGSFGCPHSRGTGP